MSYTPYTWQSGDTVTAARLNNIEQGIANAGGGSGVMYFNITSEGTFPDTTLVASKTYSELISAISSGVLPVAKYSVPDGSNIFTLAGFSEYHIGFYTVSVDISSMSVFVEQLVILPTNEVVFDQITIPVENE